MNQSVMQWSYTNPSGWADPAVIAQIIVAGIALFGPISVYLLDRRNHEKARQRREKNMEAAVLTELRYLVAFYNEVWGFWNEIGRYADHIVLTFTIQLPPLLSTPQIWTESLSPGKQKRLSALITDVHHYNQIVQELNAVKSTDSKLRNQSRAKEKFRKLEKHLKGFGLSVKPWRQGQPDPDM